MASRIALHAALAAMLINATHAASAPQWTELDPELHREADRASLERQGPWVQFTQRWGALRKSPSGGEALVERMAVNCLTGAYGQTRYPATDPVSHQQVLKTQTYNELEHAQAFEERLLLEDNSTPLGRALMTLACTCETPIAGMAPSRAEIRATYERDMAEPLSKVEYHLHFLRLRTEPEARAAIAEILAGRPFEAVFDERASAGDAGSFPHGDLGAQPETAFPIEDVRRFRSLKVGETSRLPHLGLYGWEIVRLDAKRTLAAPPLATLQPRIERYLERAAQCGWSP